MNTIGCGSNLVKDLIFLEHWDEVMTILRDKLLPVARRSLGDDHNITFMLNQRLAVALHENPESTRDNLRFRAASTPTGVFRLTV